MDDELKRRLDAQDEMIGRIGRSVEKTQRYFKWTLIISLVVIVLPLIVIAFVLPSLTSVYLNGLQGF